MQKSDYLFLLRHFNDIDQMTPVVWKMNQCGYSTRVILVNDNYDVESDYRLRFLLQKKIPVTTYVDLLKGEGIISDPLTRLMEWSKSDYSVIKTVFRKILYSQERAGWVLDQTRCRACIFEWNNPYAQLHGDFFSAAKKRHISTFCLPHGLNIYLNRDATEATRKLREKPDFSHRTSKDGFDFYVVQTGYHKQLMCDLGLVPKKTFVLGSARYCPEWQRLNQSLVVHYQNPFDNSPRKKIVFMLPQWNYNVDYEATVSFLLRLMERADIHLVIKGSTRRQGNRWDTRLEEICRKDENVRLENGVSSVALIRWADIVISFASSIGLEALLQNKILFSPEYLHSNRSIFSEMGACVAARSQEEALALLGRDLNTLRDQYTDEQVKALFTIVIFGGRENRDVLMDYVRLITGEKRN